MLEPIPDLVFYPDPLHRYMYKGNWLARSVTQVLSHDMSAATRARIDATKDGPDGWLIRGNTVHACLENFLLHGDPGDVGDFSDWVTPLLAHRLFKNFEVLAAEYSVCSPSKSLGGQFDCLLRTGKGSTVLCDLKTVTSKLAAASRKTADAQLGAYAAMLIDHHPTITIDACLTVVAGPGITTVKTSDTSDCITAWLNAWDAYNLLQPDF
jgi:hypothetical protein